MMPYLYNFHPVVVDPSETAVVSVAEHVQGGSGLDLERGDPCDMCRAEGLIRTLRKCGLRDDPLSLY